MLYYYCHYKSRFFVFFGVMNICKLTFCKKYIEIIHMASEYLFCMSESTQEQHLSMLMMMNRELDRHFFTC